MNARLERKLRSLAAVIVAGVIAGIAYNVVQGRISPSFLTVGASYGLLMSASLMGTQLFVLEGPMREWLGGLSFATGLMVRSTIYVAIITVIQWFQLGEVIAGVSPDRSSQAFWFSFVYSAVLSVVMNLALGVTNIIGPRAVCGSRSRALADSRSRRWHRRGRHRRATEACVDLTLA
jgi:adenylate cyclase